MKLRLLPVVVFFSGLILTGKVMDLAGINLIQTSSAAAPAADAAPAAAPATPVPAAPAADAKADPKTDAPAPDAKNADAKDVKDAKADDKAADTAKSDDKKTDDAAAKDGDKKDGDKKDGEKKKDEMPKNVSMVKPQENIPQFTTSEKEVLEKLAGRRAELDAWSKDLEMKESLIDASSKKLDEKIAELKQLKSDTEALLKTYNEHEDVKIRSLVKIYENMKPKDAAAIFEQMDMDIMLEIVDKMSERKASAVLAVMDPKKAKELTQQMANEKTLKQKMEKEQAPLKPQA